MCPLLKTYQSPVDCLEGGSGLNFQVPIIAYINCLTATNGISTTIYTHLADTQNPQGIQNNKLAIESKLRKYRLPTQVNLKCVHATMHTPLTFSHQGHFFWQYTLSSHDYEQPYVTQPYQRQLSTTSYSWHNCDKLQHHQDCQFWNKI